MFQCTQTPLNFRAFFGLVVFVLLTWDPTAADSSIGHMRNSLAEAGDPALLRGAAREAVAGAGRGEDASGSGPVGWERRLGGRSEDCCPSWGCSKWGCSFYGETGCGAGQYQPADRTPCPGCSEYYCSACADCPAGRYKRGGCKERDFYSKDAYAACNACAAGKYHTQTGQSSSAACKSCPQGWDTQGTAGESMVVAGVPWPSDINGAYDIVRVDCWKCTNGKPAYKQRSPGQYYLYSLPSYGWVASTRLGSSAVTTWLFVSSTAATPDRVTENWNFRPGFSGREFQASDSIVVTQTTTVGHTACKKCARGTFNDQAGQATCKTCDAGKYQPDPGQKSASDCLDCISTGAFCPAGSSSDTPCPTGHYCPNFSTQTACDAGKYHAQTGQRSEAACVNCPKGWSTQGTQGQSACALCAAGKYAEQPGQRECTNCGPGKYHTQTGQKSAAPCTAAACTAGHYCPGDGAITPCAAGKYAEQPGQRECTNCGPGKYHTQTEQLSASACKNCPVDYWCPGDGSIGGPCASRPQGRTSSGLAGQATEAGACPWPDGRTESCCLGAAVGLNNDLIPPFQRNEWGVCFDPYCTDEWRQKREDYGYGADYYHPYWKVNYDDVGDSYYEDNDYGYKRQEYLTKCDPCHYHGLGGCGAGQYEKSRTTCCQHSLYECSVCENCPVGKYKPAGCTTTAWMRWRTAEEAGIAAFDAAKARGETEQEASLEAVNAHDAYWDSLASLDDSPGCMACPAGQFQDETGKDGCKGCGAGQFQNEVSQTNCKHCRWPVEAITGLTGQATEEGACVARSDECKGGDTTTIDPNEYLGYHGCGSGQYQVGAQWWCSDDAFVQCSTCAVCPAGKYKKAGCSMDGLEACLSCPTGKDSDAGIHECTDVPSTSPSASAVEDAARAEAAQCIFEGRGVDGTWKAGPDCGEVAPLHCS